MVRGQELNLRPSGYRFDIVEMEKRHRVAWIATDEADACLMSWAASSLPLLVDLIAWPSGLNLTGSILENHA